MKGYQKLIQEIAPGANSRWIEAWMRLENGTLDGLSREMFEEEVMVALHCIAETEANEPGGNERLAKSFGLAA